MRHYSAILLIITGCFCLSLSSSAAVLVYDPIPIGDGSNNTTYIAGQDLSGTNADVLATQGAYSGGWQWPANWGVVNEGLNYTDGEIQLDVSGGALEKLYGTTSFRNLTFRKFSGATQTTTYFSCLIRFMDFGTGVDTRVGLGKLSSGLGATAYLSVNSSGVARAYMYGTASVDSFQLETNLTYLIVGRQEYDVNDGGANLSERVTLWLQPQLGLPAEPLTTETDKFLFRLEAMSDASNYLSDYIGARAAESAPVNILVDEYRVASSWTEVVPTTSAVILYEPVPIGNGTNDQTYIENQSLYGDNSNVLATTGLYNGVWQWAANYGVTAKGLDYVDEARHKQLLVSGGAFNKLYGNISYRNSTVRRFSGVAKKTTYFSTIVQWQSFGDGVETRLGLARLDGTISMMAYLSVDKNGTAKIILYGTPSSNSLTLDAGTTYLLVGRIEYDMDGIGSERFSVWLQPRLDRDTGPEAGETSDFLERFEVISNADDSLADFIGGRGDEGDGPNQVDFRVDEYRVGWTYQSVIPCEDSYNVTEKWLTANLPELTQPLNGRLPVFIWGNPRQYSATDETYVDNMYKRGLCYTPNIAGDRTSDAADKMSILEQKGYYRPVIMQTCGTVSFINAAHQVPAIVDAVNYPCLGYFQDKTNAAASRTGSFMTDLQNLGMSPNLFLFDWENWCKFLYAMADPALDTTLTNRLAEANKCPRCLANLSSNDLSSNQMYLNAVETKRGLATKDGLFAPVKNILPNSLVGNYFSTSFVASNQSLGNISQAVGWYGSQADLSMFVGYGNRYDKMKNAAFVGWNMFRYYLERYTQTTLNQVAGEQQIIWTCRLLSGDAMEDENEVNHIIYTANGDPITLYAWPRASYREYLRHCMLRDAKSFGIFYPQGNTLAQALGYQRELSDVLAVINEMHGYDDVLDTGTVLNNAGLPGDYYDHTAAVVWSGVATATKAVIRAISFTGATVNINVSVFGRTESVDATVAGVTYIINR
jgi:hypothetical protein